MKKKDEFQYNQLKHLFDMELQYSQEAVEELLVGSGSGLMSNFLVGWDISNGESEELRVVEIQCKICKFRNKVYPSLSFELLFEKGYFFFFPSTSSSNSLIISSIVALYFCTLFDNRS